jgi:hypothetical protein
VSVPLCHWLIWPLARSRELWWQGVTWASLRLLLLLNAPIRTHYVFSHTGITLFHASGRTCVHDAIVADSPYSKDKRDRSLSVPEGRIAVLHSFVVVGSRKDFWSVDMWIVPQARRNRQPVADSLLERSVNESNIDLLRQLSRKTIYRNRHRYPMFLVLLPQTGTRVNPDVQKCCRPYPLTQKQSSRIV